MSGEKGPLRTWERLYWYVFVGAIAWFLWSRLLGGKEEDAVDPAVSNPWCLSHTVRRMIAGNQASVHAFTCSI